MAANTPTDGGRSRDALLGVGGVLCAAGLYPVLGGLGLLVALLVVVAGRTSGALAGVVVLHAGALLGGSLPPHLSLLAVEAGAVALALAEFPGLRDARLVAGLLLAAGGFGAAALGLADAYGTAASALVVGLVGGLLAYGIHRYERVRLGLAGGERA
jgi:hypothetical protein